MKTEFPDHSKDHKEHIKYLSRLILKTGKDKIAFIILFGSFARGDWVYDRYLEDGITYEYASDYDFLVVTRYKGAARQAHFDLQSRLYKILDPYKRHYTKHRPQLVLESIGHVNKYLREGHYFFSDIKKEAILLYDSGKFTLNEAAILTREERSSIATEHYNMWYKKAIIFLDKFYFLFDQKKEYIASAFDLHQATENLLYCALLVLTDYKPKTHDLAELLSLCSSQNNIFLSIFPTATEEECNKFELLRAAYIDARYNKDYVITPEQLNYLIESVEALSEIVKKVCEDKIENS
ncbi:MAG: HEPN domain-containing protein [Pseudomonadota bacterium]